MNFTYKELALLNEMIEIAMLSGKIEFDEVAKSVHKKVTDKIAQETRDSEEPVLI